MYDPYGNNFIIRARQTVFKWWYVVYKPVYVLTHHGVWPAEKQAMMDSRTGNVDNTQNDLAKKMAEQIQSQGTQHIADDLISHSDDLKTNNIASTNVKTASTNKSADNFSTSSSTVEPVNTATSTSTTDEIDTSNIDSSVLDRANEIMARLAAEAAQDEAKKQQEIDEAKKAAAEQELLASIMKANTVDIAPFMEEGKAHQGDE